MSSVKHFLVIPASGPTSTTNDPFAPSPFKIEAGYGTKSTITGIIRLHASKPLKDAKLTIEVRGITETKWSKKDGTLAPLNASTNEVDQSNVITYQRTFLNLSENVTEVYYGSPTPKEEERIQREAVGAMGVAAAGMAAMAVSTERRVLLTPDPQGLIELPFSLPLPVTGLYPSFSDPRGSITYTLKSTISWSEGFGIIRSWKECITPVTVVVPKAVRDQMATGSSTVEVGQGVGTGGHVLVGGVDDNRCCYWVRLRNAVVRRGGVIEGELRVLKCPVGKRLTRIEAGLFPKVEFRGEEGDSLDGGKAATESKYGVADLGKVGFLRRMFDERDKMENLDKEPMSWTFKMECDHVASHSVESPLISVRSYLRFEIFTEAGLDVEPNTVFEIPIDVVPQEDEDAEAAEAAEKKRRNRTPKSPRMKGKTIRQPIDSGISLHSVRTARTTATKSMLSSAALPSPAISPSSPTLPSPAAETPSDLTPAPGLRQAPAFPTRLASLASNTVPLTPSHILQPPPSPTTQPSPSLPPKMDFPESKTPKTPKSPFLTANAMHSPGLIGMQGLHDLHGEMGLPSPVLRPNEGGLKRAGSGFGDAIEDLLSRLPTTLPPTPLSTPPLAPKNVSAAKKDKGKQPERAIPRLVFERSASLANGLVGPAEGLEGGDANKTPLTPTEELEMLLEDLRLDLQTSMDPTPQQLNPLLNALHDPTHLDVPFPALPHRTASTTSSHSSNSTHSGSNVNVPTPQSPTTAQLRKRSSIMSTNSTSSHGSNHSVHSIHSVHSAHSQHSAPSVHSAQSVHSVPSVHSAHSASSAGQTTPMSPIAGVPHNSFGSLARGAPRHKSGGSLGRGVGFAEVGDQPVGVMPAVPEQIAVTSPPLRPAVAPIMGNPAVPKYAGRSVSLKEREPEGQVPVEAVYAGRSISLKEPGATVFSPPNAGGSWEVWEGAGEAQPHPLNRYNMPSPTLSPQLQPMHSVPPRTTPPIRFHPQPSPNLPPTFSAAQPIHRPPPPPSARTQKLYTLLVPYLEPPLGLNAGAMVRIKHVDKEKGFAFVVAVMEGREGWVGIDDLRLRG
ncbi:hypothetical protein HK097_001387 [Rhizophlyctis rosea]|uniref:Arrestin-like N-terminal domain-containing protein n=1 Tax=Rhizophlyctis rosea TaxID=64517 RepID=A0AAD5X1D5_9FUNG|nr:hypothetical protein HK097_001387 [Rhizophlyctis rosea]